MALELLRGVRAPVQFGTVEAIPDPLPDPDFEVIVEGEDFEPLAERSRITMEQTRGSAVIVLRDLDGSYALDQFQPISVTAGEEVVWTGIMTRARQIQGPHEPGKKDVELTVVDKSWRFAHPPALISAAYQNATDQNIVIDLFAKAGLDGEFTVTSTDVDETTTGLTVTFGPRWTLQRSLDHLSDLTGARGYLDGDDVYHWNTDASAEAAPWNVDTDDPNNTTRVDVLDLEVETASDEPANDIDVIGGEGPDGLQVTAHAEDATSISTYGRFKLALEDSGWLSQSTVDAIAAAALASYKDPSFEFSFRTRKHGLRPNQLIKLTCANYGLDEHEAVIRRVEFYKQKANIVMYTVQGGNRPRTVEALMRRLRAARTSAQSVSNLLGCDFIGGADSADAGDIATLQLLDFMTISLWLYPRAVPGSDAILCAKGDGDTSGFSLEWLSTDQLNFHQATFSTTNHCLTAAAPLSLNAWNHILVKSFWTSQEAEIYINGVEATYSSRSAPNNAADADDGSPLVFGTNLDGVMALLSIFDRGLFIEEILNLAAKPEASRASSIDNCLALWPMDDEPDGSGASTLAESIASNDATTSDDPVHRLIPFVPS